MPDDIKTGIGASVKRKEDLRFITGKGNYTDDINRPGQLYAYMLRSNVAKGSIKLDISQAKDADGVVSVFLGNDMEVGGLPCGWQVDSTDGTAMREPPHPPIAKDQVRYVGEIIAVVIAETLDQARSASEKIDVNYDEQTPVIDLSSALETNNGIVHNDLETNICYDWHMFGDLKGVDDILNTADHVSEINIRNNRLIPNAIETRCAIGDYDQANDHYTLYTTSQNPHVIRLLMGAFVLSIPENKLTVISPDVGGGFGSKIFHYAEEAIVTWSSNKIKRPVKWTSDRTEAFLSDCHGRDHLTNVKLGLDKDGNFLALKVDTIANLGAYLSTFASSVPTYLYGTLLAGPYKTPAIYCRVRSVFTNTVPVDAVRGAGRPEATYVLERIIDRAAREMGISQEEIRKKNFIPPDAFPYQTPVALQYDSGRYKDTFDIAIKMSNYNGINSRKEEAKKQGKLRGIGVSTYLEACGLAPSAVAGSLGARAGLYEAAEIRVHPTGAVSVFTGSHSHGQGHETTFSQIVSDKLGIDIEQVEVVHGDTSKIPFGMGTYGSRSQIVGGEAIYRATEKIISKGKAIAAHILETDEGNIEFSEGNFTVKGTNNFKAFGEIALAAYVPHNFPHDKLEPGLDEKCFFDPPNFTYPAGCVICEVEVDPNVGNVEIVNLTAVDDLGKVINPMIVDGQIQGGLAHGIGQALLENAVYDENGQLLSASYMDYTMPRADNLPNFNVSAEEITLTSTNTLGAKGCGELGTIGCPPAVINAIVDALEPLGVKDISMPATSEKVWRAIKDAKN